MCVLLRENENRKPRQQILLPQSLDSRCCHSTQVIILFTNAKLSCLTARTHADETRRGYQSSAAIRRRGLSAVVCFGRKGRRPRLHRYELPQSFDARVNHHTWKGCRHPHIEPEQQESEKSAERRRKQLVAECWRMNTGVDSVADLPSTLAAQEETAPGTKRRRGHGMRGAEPRCMVS
jgi:hypothetical protein